MSPTSSFTRGVLAAAIAASLVVPPAPARAFELHRHSVMTYQVLHRHGVGAVGAALIAYGAMLPDVQDCIPHCYCDYAPTFCQPNPTEAIPFASDHFDNNLLDESIIRVNERMATARAGIANQAYSNPRDAALALMAFGKALHTTQDFYAHSTWLEINIFSVVFQFDLANAPIWFGEPYALYSWHHGSLSGDGSLQTGFYLAGAPGGGYTHDQLNKDSPGSSEGHQPLAILGHGTKTMYAGVSGDFDGNMSFDDSGLAPQHTLYAWNALQNGGDVFPYVFAAQANARPAADPAMAKRVADFFAAVEADPAMQAYAQAADSIVAHAYGDSIGSFPLNAVDADGVPIPLTTAVNPAVPHPTLFLGAAHPNPFAHDTEISFLAPGHGPMKIAIYDAEGRRIALLFNGDIAAGLHEIRWDGRDDTGARAPAGVYMVRLTGFGRNEARRVALTR